MTTDPGNGLPLPTLLRQFQQDVRSAESIAQMMLAEGDTAEDALAYVLSEVRLDLDLLERVVEHRATPKPPPVETPWFRTEPPSRFVRFLRRWDLA